MKQKRLWLMCGIPGSGKSTWVQKQIERIGGVVVSRDAIRFKLLKDDEDYFAHEDEVIKQFLTTTQDCIDNPTIENIFVDATHLTTAARHQTLDKLNIPKEVELNCVVFDVPLNVALQRNNQRSGRAFVPRSVIRRMNCQKEYPTVEENFNHIICVNENGEESELVLCRKSG